MNDSFETKAARNSCGKSQKYAQWQETNPINPISRQPPGYSDTPFRIHSFNLLRPHFSSTTPSDQTKKEIWSIDELIKRILMFQE